ncbi:MAG: glycosyltransferase [Nitrospiraceae bacterium]|nr:glycosyltransferase [Nitrospiraceae bacterium]
MDKLKVLHIRASNFNGGPEKQILEHLSCLDNSRFTSVLCSYARGGKQNELLDRARALGIKTCAVREKGPFDISALSNIVRVIHKEGIDLICTHGYKPYIQGWIASRITGVPIIAVSRGCTSENLKVRIYEFMEDVFLRFSDRVVAVSHGQKGKIEKAGVPAKKISVIHNGIRLNGKPDLPTDLIRREFAIGRDAAVIVSAGRLSPEKNFGLLIDAAGMITDEKIEAGFVIFGEGPLRGPLEAKIKEKGLQNNFFLPGFKKNLAEYVSGADIFVLPSFKEGLPNVVLEAFALRKPVVATRVGGIPEIVMDGISGFLVSPSSCGQLSECIIRLIRNPEMATEFGEAGYKHVRAHFDIGQQTRVYEELYMRLAGRTHEG